MRKTYWWRILFLFLALMSLTVGYAVFYQYQCGLCSVSDGICFFGDLRKGFAEPLFLLALSLLVVSPFLFFINDQIYLKWLRFAGVWLILSAVLILLMPVSNRGWMSFGPTKESTAIWMGALFAIISLALIGWETWRKK